MSDKMFREIGLASVETTLLSSDTSHSPFESRVTDFSGSGIQISKLHKRSFQETKISGHAIWADEFGNIYMWSGRKGVPIEGAMPYLEIDEHSKLGIRTHGLVDLTDIQRTQETSRTMRELGFATERITSVSRVESLMIGGRKFGIPELKMHMLAASTVQDKEALKRYLEKTEYYIVSRDMAVGERLEDLLIADRDQTGEYLRRALLPAFFYLKIAEGINLDVRQNSDIIKYLSIILPMRMGSYLGRFHERGLVHSASGSKNWLTVAHLIDDDSVKGVPIGDATPNERDVFTDVVESFTSFDSIFWFREGNGNKSYLYNQLGKDHYDFLRKGTKVKFMAEYLKNHTLSRPYAATIGGIILK